MFSAWGLIKELNIVTVAKRYNIKLQKHKPTRNLSFNTVCNVVMSVQSNNKKKVFALVKDFISLNFNRKKTL